MFKLQVYHMTFMLLGGWDDGAKAAKQVTTVSAWASAFVLGIFDTE